MRHTAYIGLGSNIGEGRTTLWRAWQEIGRHDLVDLQALSAPYLSAPVGMDSSNWFTNAVGAVSTGLTADGLLSLLMEVERDFGRQRDPGRKGYQDRTLDLDLLYFADVVLQSERLTLPHPHLAERLFVLKPLCEIAAEWRDPLDGKTVADMLARLEGRMDEGVLPRQQLSRSRWE